MDKLNQKNKSIDQEWILLVKEAKKLGLSTEDIRTFINENKPRRTFTEITPAEPLHKKVN
ncbi:hypothetical protein JCM9140_4824 [Halalkalibacter wakoensis JCM 9140]|uniref:Sin domain-containing protein n=1 Tax=Halalkalibacter wakoensis JCM 9140 TaxID=1236970 RepID=W4QA73_9BACI|nr:anti-repressor SinI family protein [Halalkalibacter wakoensis]GAE28578.1 hypothetical protein JCM9140_4824 [Halalkalibacter wakoensis JCM 9140]